MDKETDKKIASLYEKISNLDGCELKDLDLLLDLTIQKGFEFGESKEPVWIKTKYCVPRDKELVLTVSKAFGITLFVWDNSSEEWNDDVEDEKFCNREMIDAWMRIPEYGL